MIKIVTDSTVYLKKAQAEALGVEIVPTVFISDGISYQEAYSDCNDDYIDLMMKSSKNSTSHANPDAYTQVFKKIIQNGDKIFHIAMSSRLSGGHNAAILAASGLNKVDIVIFDSQMIAGSLQLLIEKARKLIGQGMDLAALSTAMEKERAKILTMFSVNDISALRKSGRIGIVREGIGNILNLKPVLILKDGGVESIGSVQGDNKLINRFIDFIPPNTKEIVISFLKNSKMANSLYYTIKNKFQRATIKLQKFGPVLGVHVGEEAIGIALVRS